MATLLLYHFSRDEIRQLRTLAGFLPGVKVIPVERGGYGMCLQDVLSGKTPPPMCFAKEMERKMLVIADAKGEQLHLLLSAAGQVTKGQNILRAVVTETNRAWSGMELYAHLLEEEAELTAMQKERNVQS